MAASSWVPLQTRMPASTFTHDLDSPLQVSSVCLSGSLACPTVCLMSRKSVCQTTVLGVTTLSEGQGHARHVYTTAPCPTVTTAPLQDLPSQAAPASATDSRACSCLLLSCSKDSRLDPAQGHSPFHEQSRSLWDVVGRLMILGSQRKC